MKVEMNTFSTRKKKIRKELKSTYKNNKSAGPQVIPPQQVKHGSEKLILMVQVLFQRVLKDEKVPKE